MSKIEIINRALLKLGEAPVSSVGEIAFGQSYDMIYEDMKKMLLSVYPWRFAVLRKKLARCVAKVGDKFKYVLPDNYLLLLKVAGCENIQNYGIHSVAVDGFEIAENAILIDEDDGIEIEYVANVGEHYFTPVFKEALIAKIASELSMRMKHSINFKQIFDNEFFNLIKQAELNNEIVKNMEILPDSSWVNIRQNW